MIGLMSGTSLDGLDVAFCHFRFEGRWEFSIEKARTYAYNAIWKERLSSAHHLSGQSLHALHQEYGRFLGTTVMKFMRQFGLTKVDAIASHGHTIFHQPHKHFTYQLGDGVAINAVTGIPVISDFRSLDVALGGEGAPLVPVGDRLLFGAYDYCLNLGGIANISMEKGKQRKAFDICFCNMALNFLMGEVGKSYDVDGRMASGGKVHHGLMDSLNHLYSRYQKKRPSLGREMFEKELVPFLNDKSISIQDRLRTVCESITESIRRSIPSALKGKKMLVTGGGARNKFLVDLMNERLPVKIAVPQHSVLDFKEALIFAFLGVLRLRNENNVLKSVTHASADSCGGIVIGC